MLISGLVAKVMAIVGKDDRSDRESGATMSIANECLMDAVHG